MTGCDAFVAYESPPSIGRKRGWPRYFIWHCAPERGTVMARTRPEAAAAEFASSVPGTLARAGASAPFAGRFANEAGRPVAGT
jgi:hypothetical protein